MNRRGFLSSCLALAAAPAIVRADSLMRIIPRNTEVLQYAEYEWRQVAAPVIVDFASDEFSQLISSVMIKHRERIAANIIKKNALLKEMLREQLMVVL